MITLPILPKLLTNSTKSRKNRTLSTGRVRKAVVIAATSNMRRVILKKEVQLKAIDNLRRQGLLHSSSSWSSATACFEEKQRGRNPTKFARFWVRFFTLVPRAFKWMYLNFFDSCYSITRFFVIWVLPKMDKDCRFGKWVLRSVILSLSLSLLYENVFCGKKVTQTKRNPIPHVPTNIQPLPSREVNFRG